MPSNTLSLIIPAFNEAGNIRAACTDVACLAERFLSDYEILVFDDKSADQTAEIVKELQKDNPHIILYRNSENKGLGYNYRAGVLSARLAYTMLVPGDNEVTTESLEGIFRRIGSADIIICYIDNPQVRPMWRQWLSKIFTVSLNLLFGLKVRYYNGPSVIRSDLARRVVPETSGFAYMAVMLVQLLKAGCSYHVAPVSLRHRHYGKTKAFRPKNIASVVKNVLVLFWKVMICHQVIKPMGELFPPVEVRGTRIDA